MVEIAIVLAIVGLILGAIWVAAASVFSNNRITQATQDIMTMANNMRSTFEAASTFSSSGDQTANMITAGIVPRDLIDSTGTAAKNEWNGAVKIYLSTPDNRHFRISYYGTPASVCFGIASQLANLGTSDAPVNLVTNSGGSSATITSTGLTTTAIKTACDPDSSGRNVAGSASTEFDFTIH